MIANEINWPYWAILPEVRQWEACALSLGLNPPSLKPSPNGWLLGRPGSAPMFDASSFASPEVEQEFENRRRLLEASIFKFPQFFRTTSDLVVGARWKVTIMLPEFARWAVHCKLKCLPDELLAMALDVIEDENKATEPVEEKQPIGVVVESRGRPNVNVARAAVLRKLVEVFMNGEAVPTLLPSSAKDLLDACQRAEKTAKKSQDMFRVMTVATFKDVAISAGLRFKNGKPPLSEEGFWVSCLTRTMEKMPPNIFL